MTHLNEKKDVYLGDEVMFVLDENNILEEPSDDFDDFAARALHGKVTATTDYYITIAIAEEECPIRRLIVMESNFGKLRYHPVMSNLQNAGPTASA